MKKLSFAFLLISLTLTSCFKEVVVGSGSKVSEERRVAGAFNEIVVKGSIDVQVKQGDSVKIVAKDFGNVLPFLTTRVLGNRLIIDYEQAWITNSSGEVTITLPRLKGVEITGSSDVSSIGNFRFDDLLLDISGSGNINLAGSAKNVNLRVSGSGDYRAFDMPTDTVRLKISGSGAAQIAVNKLLDAQITGSGDVVYKGNPSVTSQVSGSGRIRKF
jgi:hypothetical protein